MNEGTRTEVAQAAARPQNLPVTDTSEFSELLDTNRFAQIQRVAKLFSESDLVPEVFQGKPANCAVALQMAFRMRIDPMMLMQNMYIVHGRPGIEAKLAIALMNQRGPFEGPVQWSVDGEGDKRQWTAFATHRATGERCQATVTWAMVKAEGWADKSGSKWKSIPDLMGRYRSAMFLGRLYCPEVLLGLPTDDELRDTGPRMVIGERVNDDSGVINMPRARPKAVEQDASAGGEPNIETSSDAAKPAAVVDPKPAAAEAKTNSEPPFALDGAAPDYSVLASEAQRNMIIKMAKNAGLSVAQLDEHLVAKYSFGVDELPLAMVGAVTEFVRTLKAA